MTDQEIYDKIAQVLTDKFEVAPEKISNSLNFRKDLDIDSIDMVELVLELEDAFNTEIPDEEAEKIVTVQDAVNYIKATK